MCCFIFLSNYLLLGNETPNCLFTRFIPAKPALSALADKKRGVIECFAVDFRLIKDQRLKSEIASVIVGAITSEKVTRMLADCSAVSGIATSTSSCFVLPSGLP